MARLVPRSGHCELDGVRLEVSIGNYGQTIVRCPGCERRRAHRCMECGAAVQGKAWRCAAHIKARRQLMTKRCEVRHRAERRKAERKRYAKMTPEQRARRSEVKRAWRKANKTHLRMAKRKGRLDGTFGYSSREKYLAAQAYQNSKRVERKREQMRELGRQRSPWRDKEPTCKECGVVIEWNRLGRPRLRCAGCQPMRVAA